MKSILIADDMAVLRQPIAATLQQNGYQVYQAADGREALDLFEQHHPDLILTDLAMPNMDGREFLQTLRASSAAVPPVILFTAVSDKNYVLEVAKLGIKDFMLKSRFSLEDLIEKIQKLIGPGGSEDPTGVEPKSRAPGAHEPREEPDAPRLASASTLAEHADQEKIACERLQGLGPYDPDRPIADMLRLLNPIVSKQQMDEHIANCRELKAMSPTVAQLLKITASSESSLDQVVSAVKQDQAIALKVLKLANSAIYNRGKVVESVHQAVMNIGMDQIRQVALNIAVIDSFAERQGADALFNPILFWEHSIAVGLAASAIAKACGRPLHDVESAFTMGLLHDIGRMVMTDQLDDDYRHVVEVTQHLRLPLETVELRLLGIPHTDLVERVLGNWKFPPDLVAPIAMHHLALSNIRSPDKDIVCMAYIIALANRLAHALCLGSSGNNTLYPFEEFVAAVKLKPTDYERLLGTLPDQTYDLKMAMVKNTDHLDPPDYRTQLVREWPDDVTAHYVTLVDSQDCYELMLRRLEVLTSIDMGPALAIIRFCNPSDRVPIGQRITQLDEVNGRRVPCILISPKGNIRLEENLMSNRNTVMVSSPTPVQRLIEAVRLLSDSCQHAPVAS